VNLLATIQAFCRRQALQVPTTVVGNTDPQIVQILALLEETGDDLASRGPWMGLQHTQSFTTLAAQQQSQFATMGCKGFHYLLSYFLYDITGKRIVAGPVEPNEWQLRTNAPTAGPRYAYRVQYGCLQISPVPPAGQTWTFDYVSRWWKGTVYSSDPELFPPAANLIESFTADTNVFCFPSSLMLQGLRARWKQEKGLGYAQDKDDYEIAVNNLMARDRGASPIDMSEGGRQFAPGVFVPEGNWNIS
jgi:hypothetical protein